MKRLILLFVVLGFLVSCTPQIETKIEYRYIQDTSKEERIQKLESKIESYEATLKAAKIQRESKNTSLIWLWKYIEASDFDGDSIRKSDMTNNPLSKDVTFKELYEFLQKDDTDKKPYDWNNWNCSHISLQLHNNAEKTGI